MVVACMIRVMVGCGAIQRRREGRRTRGTVDLKTGTYYEESEYFYGSLPVQRMNHPSTSSIESNESNNNFESNESINRFESNESIIQSL